MGRNITTNLVVTLTAKQRALQDGTPKFLPTGESRACYAMLSTVATAGLAFLDKYFQPTRASTSTYSASSQNIGVHQYTTGGDAQTTAGLFSGGSTTATPVSSGATAGWVHATNSAGEFGNAMIDVYSNSTASPVSNRNSASTNKYYSNHMFVDSDHADRSIVYTLNGPTFRAVGRIDGDYNYDYPGTCFFNITGINANMYGSASYNAVRKELAVLSFTATAGSFTLSLFQGIDFDKYPSPALAFADAAVVRTDKAVSLAVSSSWATNDVESFYNPKPTLCDNGDIYVTVMFISVAFKLYKLVRDGALNQTVTAVASKTLTTSYGRDTNFYYGQRRIQSRDGGAVLCFCTYYYYGSGVQTFIIDKRQSLVSASTMFDSTHTAAGFIPVPYGDSGFAEFFCGNGYASNYASAYITAVVERSGATNSLLQTGTNILMPYFPVPNTTNYLGFTQVVDFSMLTNQFIV